MSDRTYAADAYADGWGVVAELSTGRTAGTLGHSSPYTTPAKTGNLPEDHEYVLNAVMRHGDSGWISLGCTAKS